MASNDQPFSNLPSRFSKLSLRSSQRNANVKDDAKKSHVAPAKAPNRDSGDETVNDRRRKIEVFDIKNVDNLADCVVRSVRIAIANNEAMIAKEQNVTKTERAVPDWQKVPTFSGQCSGENIVPSSNGSSWSHDRMVRDKNKNLRRIYQEEGLDYGKDVSAAELKSRISTAVELRQNSIAKVFKVLNASRDAQLCFLVDVTGSMEKYIDGVRDSIFKIVEKLSEKHGHSAIAKKVSLAFVGYRDIGYTKQFELQPFTENAEDFRQFCRAIKTQRCSDRDSAEDVFGGLEKATRDLSWSDKKCTKIIFHIADRPCHGRKYHSSNYADSDRFPDGDPGRRTKFRHSVSANTKAWKT